jgi:spore maturation protein CgeB
LIKINQHGEYVLIAEEKFDIVILGLTITSSWGNGHATTYRALIKELSKMGHSVLFLEQDMPWYGKHRDFITLPYVNVKLYANYEDLKQNYTHVIRFAELVIIGSYVPDGISVVNWVLNTAKGIKAFYDIDTPQTLKALSSGECFYLNAQQIPQFDLYLSFSGGGMIRILEHVWGAKCARILYCSVDPDFYFPGNNDKKYSLGYMGTYSKDRENCMKKILLEPAIELKEHKFIIAGPQYPDAHLWASNITHIEHISPLLHRNFYCSMEFTLNITRTAMANSGYSPSVRLFEAAACGTPIISDYWDGLNEIFEIGKEILISRSKDETKEIICTLSQNEKAQIGLSARKKVMQYHTAHHRVNELLEYVRECKNSLKKIYD